MLLFSERDIRWPHVRAGFRRLIPYCNGSFCKIWSITPSAVARRLCDVISMFPNYGGYANNNRPITNQNGRSVLKCINVPWCQPLGHIDKEE